MPGNLIESMSFVNANPSISIFCAYLHGPLQSRTDKEDRKVLPGVRWEENAYNDNSKKEIKIAQENSIGATQPIDFYDNERAQKLSKNYFRYIVARWGTLHLSLHYKS